MRKFINKLARDERGVSALEYAILAALIVGAVVIGIGTFKTTLTGAFTSLSGQVSDAVGSASDEGGAGS